MPVVGMGGYFFRAKDPETLKAWYREHLGVGGGMGQDPVTGHSNEWVWYQQGGPTVFEPFKADTDYFPADRSAMEGVGRFARVHDPEGNPIELWEPPAEG